MPTAPPKVLHAGACCALKHLSTCTCPGWNPAGQVAGYAQCVCGHTQQAHALIEPAPPAAPADPPVPHTGSSRAA